MRCALILIALLLSGCDDRADNARQGLHIVTTNCITSTIVFTVEMTPPNVVYTLTCETTK